MGREKSDYSSEVRPLSHTRLRRDSSTGAPGVQRWGRGQRAPGVPPPCPLDLPGEQGLCLAVAFDS